MCQTFYLIADLKRYSELADEGEVFSVFAIDNFRGS
jgi:hypothetical protein